jgi:hypothetical protein
LFARDSVGEWTAVAVGTVAVGGATVLIAVHDKHTAPILTFAGVLLVALITAFSATRGRQAESDRQRQRLDAESARQRDSLDAERSRLEVQLAHERAMSDLDHVRSLLDDAAVKLHEADYARYEIEVARMSHGASLAEKAPEEIKRAREVGKELDGLSERLAIRLGPDHDAVTEFRRATAALLAVFRLANTPERFVLDGVKHHHDFEAANSQFNDARAAFLAAASKTAGVRVPS